MTYEFTIFSPLDPTSFAFLIVVFMILCIYWLWKWIPSIGTGAGGS